MGMLSRGRRNRHTTGTVEKTVSSLDGVVDSVGASVVVDLPQTKANEWHLSSRSVDCHRRVLNKDTYWVASV